MTSAPRVAAVGTSLPQHYASQEDLIQSMKRLWATKYFNLDRLEDLHRSVQVGGRYLAVPPAELEKLDSFSARNDAWIRVAQEVGEAAVRGALTKAGLTP